MRLRLLSLLAVFAVALGGCGGDGQDATDLLDRAFREPIERAAVTADLELRVDGVEELREPLRLKLSGPYVSGGDERLPGFDWDVSFSGGGQTISAGLVSTQDNVFVTFQGTAYEAGKQQIAQVNRDLAAGAKQDDERSFESFGVKPRDWLRDAEVKGDERVAGVETTHVEAKVDVGRMLDDLNTLIDRAGGAVPGTPPPPKLTPEQREAVQQVVKNPVLDVYVGKEDDTIRRLAANIELSVPEEDRERVGGIEGGNISLTIEFAGVGDEQRIEAPRDARPLSELARQLGGLGSLGGAAPGGAPPGGGSGDAFERYTKCLEQADPSDIDAIEACSSLLEQG